MRILNLHTVFGVKRKIWNRCDVCGKFIGFKDLEKGLANIRMTQPDWEYGDETWETLCKNHYKGQK